MENKKFELPSVVIIYFNDEVVATSLYRYGEDTDFDGVADRWY